MFYLHIAEPTPSSYFFPCFSFKINMKSLGLMRVVQPAKRNIIYVLSSWLMARLCVRLNHKFIIQLELAQRI